MSGCTSPQHGRSLSGGRALTLNDFVRVDAGTVGPANRVHGNSLEEPVPEASETGDSPRVVDGPVATSPNRLNAPVREPVPGELVVIDSLVGEVNGRPIYAEQFFAPIDAYLRDRASRLNATEFDRELDLVIQTQLRTVVQNELFLAQARAGLSPEEQQGLFHWMGQIQENLIAQGGGTRASATNRLLESEGASIDEKVQQITDQALLRRLFDEKIRSRVIVSWRDIEREYERNRNKYNAPARVSLARISLLNDTEAAVIEEVKRRLAAGESFQSVAESLGSWQDGRWQTYQLGPDGVAGIELQPQFRTPLIGLTQGDTTAPIVTERSTWWLHISEFLEPTSRSIYDPGVQIELRREIEGRLIEVEQNRYLESLIDEEILDDLTAMKDRLIVIARRRYRP